MRAISEGFGKVSTAEEWEHRARLFMRNAADEKQQNGSGERPVWTVNTVAESPRLLYTPLGASSYMVLARGPHGYIM